MFTDQFVLDAFEDIDAKLELALQQSSFVGQDHSSSNSDQLKKLQDQLWLVKNEVVALTASLRQRRVRLPNIKLLKSVLESLQEDAPSDFVAVSDNVEGPVRAAIIQYVTVCLYYCVVQKSLDQLPLVHDTAQYYSEIHDSTRWSLLYALQVAPQRLVHEANAVKNDVSRSASWRAMGSLEARSIGTAWYHRLVEQCRKMVMVHNFQLVGVPRDAKKVVSSLWALPLAAVRDEVGTRRQAADTLFNSTASRLGALMTQFPATRDTEARVALLSTFFNHSRASSPGGSEKALLAVMPEVMTLAPASKIQAPGFLTRYWPTLLCSLAYGPSSAFALWQSRDKILQFFQENVVDFCAGLIQNWIWTPLQQVWSTVRHDESQPSIAVASKGSLDSEFSSLTRMVVQLVAENSDGHVNTDALAVQVENGDLTEFMQIYERQIHHPVKNILTGKLVRSLLIQIQKTKVDASLALNGIDKLLSSQQLVFGVVAMSPALLIVYSIWTCIYRLSKLGRIWSNVAQFRFRLMSSMNNIERLLNYNVSEIESSDKDLNTGLLALEVVSARRYGEKLVPKKYRGQWTRDVGELVDPGLNNTARLNVVNRIYHVYGRYL
ncbi:Nca2p [Lachancea thermotolerans CBS 6340]|uniref:KLTH0G02310p n=1 Tax=Lachancea thermotolerans (strain ATCC 56472 / CBS 6340 / NRRL Y-8284) TaxID=559295 RepID=C5DLP1_LACTC|nr:KLTH0G02310p [Lachancea thermotolerans CBS 6340]CAR24702.1 KLTH0G02310p [Lachancea thermotolerans CBS 6340]